MTAATTPRNVQALGPHTIPELVRAPLKANAVVLAGTLAAYDSTGYFVAVTATTGLNVCGWYENSGDNTGGASGAKVVAVRQGVIKLANSASGDLIAQSEVGKTVYAADNQTAAKTDNSGARSAAGKVFQIDEDGSPYVSLRLPV